jgi:hypothetical protein
MRKFTIPVAVATALWSAPVFAQELEVPGEYRIYEENDYFNWFTEATDRYYTQGLRLERLKSSWAADADFLPGVPNADWCALVCGAGASHGAMNTGYALGQNMYTPADISIATPQPNDRPWAGLLYVSRIARVSYQEPSLKAQRQDRIEVSLGIVGPASLAGETQDWWHGVIEVGRPRGWNNQLRNEPVMQLHYETALRWQTERANADITPRLRGNLGNALVSLEAEVTGRIGWNLRGFGVSSISAPAPPPPAAPATIERSNSMAGAGILPSANLFARVGIKAVAHNIFLDGNTFANNDIRIDRKPFVPEFALGIEANLFSRLWATFMFIHRGSEFERRNGRDAPAQEFGSITLAWMFG